MKVIQDNDFNQLVGLIKGVMDFDPDNYKFAPLEITNSNQVKLSKKPPLHGIRPSADITMNSASRAFNGNIIGIVLSGMGKDGAIGVRNIKHKGGTIIAQNKDTSVVHGMPKAALDTGSVDHVLPYHKITAKLVEIVNNV